MALYRLCADTDRKVVCKSVRNTALDNSVYIESINGHAGEHYACIQVRGHICVDPDGTTNTMESQFCIELEFHGQTLVVIAVHLVHQLRVRRQ